MASSAEGDSIGRSEPREERAGGAEVTNVTEERQNHARPRATSATGPYGWLVLSVLAAAIFGLDQLTKRLIVASLAPMGVGYSVPVLGDYVRFVYVTNTGSAFSLFTDRSVILAIIAFAAIPVLLFGQSYLPVTGWGAKVCVGLLIGGTLGNLADRIQYGHVVDFISAGVGNLRWPTFNVADSAFTVGVLLMILLVLLNPEERVRGDGARS